MSKPTKISALGRPFNQMFLFALGFFILYGIMDWVDMRFFKHETSIMKPNVFMPVMLLYVIIFFAIVYLRRRKNPSSQTENLLPNEKAN